MYGASPESNIKLLKQKKPNHSTLPSTSHIDVIHYPMGLRTVPDSSCKVKDSQFADGSLIFLDALCEKKRLLISISSSCSLKMIKTTW